MTSKHSIYKKDTRWEKASEIDKTRSTYQRKINIFNRRIRGMHLRARAKNIVLRKHAELFHKLVSEGIVSKEYLKPYLPRYRDVVKNVLADYKKIAKSEDNNLDLPDGTRRDSQQRGEDAKWKHPNPASSAEQTGATSLKPSAAVQDDVNTRKGKEEKA